MLKFRWLIFVTIVAVSKTTFANLPETIKTVQPSIVGVGLYGKLNRPSARFLGTGFVVGNGQYVATNAHVIPELVPSDKKQNLFVVVGKGRNPPTRRAEVIAIDEEHDLALLKISGKPLTPLNIERREVYEGEKIAFTGYPIGSVLGYYPVTHQGIISSITPIVIPARTAKELSIKQLKQLKNPYLVYQLDATAYPGNSGSPLYLQDSGKVIGVINKVLVKSTKESILSDPSAITYAIPIKYLLPLLESVRNKTN
ncbi:S1 family peptidase [Vibrio algarum]|uniref:Serine protease n=1 Tax=Vibrio algarum TaxID=3020714 RepID=A0ABT4YRK7_9VIBR|nr:serine protease [Vibrio sp. KJ40-1]MDB1123703.1 serine protease [Vibrio sp. KJ40-1]